MPEEVVKGGVFFLFRSSSLCINSWNGSLNLGAYLFFGLYGNVKVVSCAKKKETLI